MEFTSKALGSLAEVGGPRCCKRDAFLSFQKAIGNINENYGVTLESEKINVVLVSKANSVLRKDVRFTKVGRKR